MSTQALTVEHGRVLADDLLRQPNLRRHHDQTCPQLNGATQ